MFVPTLNNVLVKPIEKKEESIVLSDDISELIIGEIVSTGQGTRNTPMELGEEYKVYFYKNRAIKITLENEVFYIIDQADILVYELT